RRVLEREDLERPPDERQRRRADPQRALEEVREERGAQGELRRSPPRLERLERVAGVVTARGDEREPEAEREIAAAHPDGPHAAIVVATGTSPACDAGR